MLDVTENGLSILRSETVELGERHLVRDKVLPKKESCICSIIIIIIFLLSEHSSILFFSFMNQTVPKAK